MIEVQASEIANIQMILIMGVVILVFFLLLNGIISWNIKKLYQTVEKQDEKTEKQNERIASLELHAAQEKGMAESIKGRYDTHQKVVDHRLDDHGRRLDKHALKLTVIEERIKIKRNEQQEDSID